MAESKTKQPYEVLDFDIDAYRELEDGDVLASAYAAVTGPDEELVIEKTTFTADRAKVWLSGGTDKKRYLVTVYMPTRDGRLLEAEFTIHVKDKK